MPPACKAGALPNELKPHRGSVGIGSGIKGWFGGWKFGPFILGGIFLCGCWFDLFGGVVFFHPLG